MIFECQPSVVRGSNRSPAQMLFTHVVSDAPVPAVCWVLWLFQARLGKASESQSVPKQVCDSSTWASPAISVSRPDKESDLWRNKTGSVSLRHSGRSYPKNPAIPTYPQMIQMWWQASYQSACWWRLFLILHLHQISILSPLPLWTHQSSKHSTQSFMQMCLNAKKLASLAYTYFVQSSIHHLILTSLGCLF